MGLTRSVRCLLFFVLALSLALTVTPTGAPPPAAAAGEADLVTPPSLPSPAEIGQPDSVDGIGFGDPTAEVDVIAPPTPNASGAARTSYRFDLPQARGMSSAATPSLAMTLQLQQPQRLGRAGLVSRRRRDLGRHHLRRAPLLSVRRSRPGVRQGRERGLPAQRRPAVAERLGARHPADRRARRLRPQGRGHLPADHPPRLRARGTTTGRSGTRRATSSGTAPTPTGAATPTRPASPAPAPGRPRTTARSRGTRSSPTTPATATSGT